MALFFPCEDPEVTEQSRQIVEKIRGATGRHIILREDVVLELGDDEPQKTSPDANEPS